MSYKSLPDTVDIGQDDTHGQSTNQDIINSVMKVATQESKKANNVGFNSSSALLEMTNVKNSNKVLVKAKNEHGVSKQVSLEAEKFMNSRSQPLDGSINDSTVQEKVSTVRGLMTKSSAPQFTDAEGVMTKP